MERAQVSGTCDTGSNPVEGESEFFKKGGYMLVSIVLVVIGAISLIFGLISRAMVRVGAGVTMFGLPPQSYLDFTNTLLLFAVAIALIIKFQRK